MIFPFFYNFALSKIFSIFLLTHIHVHVMRKMTLNKFDYDNLVDRILAILLKKGIKASTMDDIAIKLSVSKRTLYEVFINKNIMAAEAMNRLNFILLDKILNYEKDAETVMDSIMMSFYYYRQLLREMNVDFLRDFDNLPPEVRKRSDEAYIKYINNFYNLLDRAAKEGYIRNDLNYRLKFRITQIQLTQVKKMGEVYPPDISLLQVYDATAIGFLRGIASPLGLSAIDSRIVLFKDISSS